jgi:hypothetical protein
MDAAPQAVLTWDRGQLQAECDRAAIVRQGVDAYLGRSVFAPTGDIVVRVQLSRGDEPGARVVATVTKETRDGKVWGERSVSGEAQCESLDEPLTLVIALMVDAAEAPVTAKVEPEPAVPQPPQGARPSPVPEPAHEGEIITAPSLEQAPATASHWAVLGFGIANMGAEPEVAGGGGLALSYKPKRFWGVGVEGEVLAARRSALESGSLAISVATVGVDLCPLQDTDDHAWWSLCASGRLARVHAKSRGLSEAVESTQLVIMPGLVARAAYIVGRRFLVGGGLQASFPVSPDRYVYRDSLGVAHPAFELSPLVLSVNFGVGLIIN